MNLADHFTIFTGNLPHFLILRKFSKSGQIHKWITFFSLTAIFCRISFQNAIFICNSKIFICSPFFSFKKFFEHFFSPKIKKKKSPNVFFPKILFKLVYLSNISLNIYQKSLSVWYIFFSLQISAKIIEIILKFNIKSFHFSLHATFFPFLATFSMFIDNHDWMRYHSTPPLNTGNQYFSEILCQWVWKHQWQWQARLAQFPCSWRPCVPFPRCYLLTPPSL